MHTNSLEYWNDMKISFANQIYGRTIPFRNVSKKHLFFVRDIQPDTQTVQPSSPVPEMNSSSTWSTPPCGVWWLTFFPWDLFISWKWVLKIKNILRTFLKKLFWVGDVFFFLGGGGWGGAYLRYPIFKDIRADFPTQMIKSHQIRRGRWTWWTKGGWVESRVVVGVGCFFCCRKSFQDDLRFKSM